MFRNNRIILREILTSWSDFGKVVSGAGCKHYIQTPCSINSHGTINNKIREKSNLLSPVTSIYSNPKHSFSMSRFQGNKKENSNTDKCAESQKSGPKEQKTKNEKVRIVSLCYLCLLNESDQMLFLRYLFSNL